MEQLARVVAIALIVALVVGLGGLWLLHTAINDGNVWKGIFGLAAATAGLGFAGVSAGALSAG